MTKIALVADKVSDELKFIKNLREITGASISDIKNHLRNKTPFYVGDDWDDEETLKKIIKFTSTNKDAIRLFELEDGDSLDEMEEISEELFENRLQARRQPCVDDLVESYPYIAEVEWTGNELDPMLRWCWEQLGPCYGFPFEEGSPYPGSEAVLDAEYMQLIEPDEIDGVWTTMTLGKTDDGAKNLLQVFFEEQADRDAFAQSLTKKNRKVVLHG